MRPRTPLLRPNSYFAAHDGRPPLEHALLAVGLVTLATAVGTWLLLAELSTAIDTTVQTDNPAYPGEFACEDSTLDDTPPGCDEPKRVERDLGELVASELSWLPPAALVVVPVFWLGQSVLLHLATWLTGGEGRFTRTATVAAWGLAPSLLRLAVVGAVLAVQLRTTTGGSPETAVATLQSVVAAVRPVGLAAALVVACWAGLIRTYGLVHARDLQPTTAAGVVATLTLVGLLLELT